jgi:ornithine carbamoyltransferase
MYNLRNRRFLKEIDFTSRELDHLLTLAAALKATKYAGTEVRLRTHRRMRLDG